MYLNLFEALKDLAVSYDRYCNSPGIKTLQQCIAAHGRALEQLDKEASARIDPLIEEQIKAGNSAHGQALKTLELATEEQRRREAVLGARVGFSDLEVDQLGTKARSALQRSRKTLPVRDTERIRIILCRLHDQVRHAFNTSRNEPRAKKKAHRADAKEYIRLQLWMVGAIVVNAEHRNLFHLSYATSVGMSAVRTINRKALGTRTCDRPTLTGTDDVAESA